MLFSFGICGEHDVYLACKLIQGAGHKQGPNLNGLFGRVAGTTAGYSYSAANKSSGTCLLYLVVTSTAVALR
jgi:cytochrome c2